MNLVLKKMISSSWYFSLSQDHSSFPCTDVVKRNDILIMRKVWKEIIPFRTSYFTNMTKYALVDWYNFTWNWYLLPLLLGCEESGLFFMVYWKVILKQEDFFPVTRCLSFDQLSSILQAPTPPSTRHLVVTWCNVTLENALFYFHSIILKINANIKTSQPLLQTLI